jgi:hypothetical protein
MNASCLMKSIFMAKSSYLLVKLQTQIRRLAFYCKFTLYQLQSFTATYVTLRIRPFIRLNQSFKNRGASWSMKWGPGQLLILGPMAHAARTESRRKGPKGARNVSGALEISRDNTMARTPLFKNTDMTDNNNNI